MARQNIDSKLVERATATRHQIRQHRDGTYQVIRGRYTERSTPVATARTLESARRLAATR
jgi:hypothetical protein